MPKKGDIVFYHSHGSPVDRLISFFSRSKAGIIHIAIFAGDGDKTYEINAFERSGFSSISTYAGDEYEIKSYLDITEEQRGGIIKYCQGNFGESYDYLEILKIFLMYFNLHLPYHERKRRICSTFVYKAYQSVGIILGSHGEDSTPEDIYEVPELVDAK